MDNWPSVEIRIEDLFYIYKGGDQTVVALRGLHLTIHAGECLVIKGPNGSGKSTLVKLLSGYYSPTAGKILIGDQDISEIDPLRLRREYVASIDQRGNLITEITVIENLVLAYCLTGNSKSVGESLANDLLTMHGLLGLFEQFPEQLSAGERQLLSLLAAIATNPKILVVDEPSGELDNESAEKIYSLLKSIAGETTVVLVTHDDRAEYFGDRIVRIREGKLSEEWVPGEVEESVVDPFGWMRVREIALPLPKRKLQKLNSSREIQLVVKNIGLDYGSKKIFSGVNIEAASGELIALDGGSGSGKSSLLRILCGIQDSSIGEIFITENRIQYLDRSERAELRNEHISFLSQNSNAFENVSLSEYLGSTPIELGKAFDLRMKNPLSAFSGGERAWIELLKIVAEGKPILVLDEPTSQMDERRTFEAAQILFNYVDHGGLIIMSTREEIFFNVADKTIRL
ncbi:MAG TPA: ATP-binding cassette domain-containing protein [Candidatus Nanopelagicaceae bacterium]